MTTMNEDGFMIVQLHEVRGKRGLSVQLLKQGVLKLMTDSKLHRVECGVIFRTNMVQVGNALAPVIWLKRVKI